jgi:hypothetical protein
MGRSLPRLPSTQPPVQQPPYFHQESGTVRFWVQLDGGDLVGATISKETLHYRFRGHLDGSDSVAVYTAYREAIDAAVRRRFAAGSREPVMLREFDVAPRRGA